MKRRISAVLLALVMVLSLFPATVLAADDETPANSKELKDNGDGTYTITLSVTGQGDTAGLDYVFTTIDDVVRTDRLLIKNLKTNKVLQITQEIGKVPVLSFGNSGGDCAMHNFCMSNKLKSAAFMLIADDEDRDHANREKALKLGVEWREAGYHVISMRDDFKTIYGYWVQKVNFIF